MHDFPKIGKDIGAVPILKKLIENNHITIPFVDWKKVEEILIKDKWINE